MSTQAKVLLSHPRGNANVRQALAGLYEHDLLAEFWTTIRWNPEAAVNSMLPAGVRAELNRRSYPQIPGELVHARPWRELCRLASLQTGFGEWIRRGSTSSSVMDVSYALDRTVAKRVSRADIGAVHGYEDCALETYRAARRNAVAVVHEQQGAYWKFRQELLSEEAELCPEWAGTIPCLKDSPEKNARKDEELALADRIIVASHYTMQTLPEFARHKAHMCPYGAPPAAKRPAAVRPSKLRVLFVGALTQLKGLSYLLRAIRSVEKLVDFTLIGSRVGANAELENALARYRYLPTLPHSEVLAEMGRHDVFVFPSLSEGFGLVILEALSRGLPVITTRNTGGPEVIREGREGFFVPIRSSEAIAEKLELLAGDHDLLNAMSDAAWMRAQECTWQQYRELVSANVAELLEPAKEVTHG